MRRWKGPSPARQEAVEAKPSSSSLTAEGKISALSFGQVTGFRHINLWNTRPFNYDVISFSVALQPNEFVIKPGCCRPGARQRQSAYDLLLLMFRYLRGLRRWSKLAFRLLTILWLLKPFFSTFAGSVSRIVRVTRIDHSYRNNARNNSHCRKTTQLPRYSFERVRHVPTQMCAGSSTIKLGGQRLHTEIPPGRLICSVTHIIDLLTMFPLCSNKVPSDRLAPNPPHPPLPVSIGSGHSQIGAKFFELSHVE